MAEHRGDFIAAGTLDIHEIRVGTLHQAFQLAFLFLFFNPRIEQVLG